MSKAVAAKGKGAAKAPAKEGEEVLEIGDVDPIDEFCLASIFDEATTFLSSSAASSLKLTDAQKLRFYALFKQATVGPCNVPKPGLLEFVAKAKWQAWNDLKTMTKDTAVAQYVSDLEKIAPSWAELAGKAKESGAPAGSGGGGGGGDDMKIAPMTSRPVYDDPEGEITEKEKTITYFASVNDLTNVRAAMGRGVSVNTVDGEGRTALHWAADRGHSAMAKLLITDFKADVNVKDGEGQTPLHYACTCEFDEIAAALLLAGANKDVKDESGETPASIAKDSSNKKLKALFAANAGATAGAGAAAAAAKK